MEPSRLEQAREDLAALRHRLATGEIEEATYQRQRRLILADLTPEERAELGPITPTPATPTGAIPLGPSGGEGGGHRTLPDSGRIREVRGGEAGHAVPGLAELDLEPGTVLLDQWQIVRELGRGGFGAVYEAEELNLGQTQAVKVLAPAMVAQDKLLARFRREVTLMRELVHPHVGRVYDYREDLTQDLALISMEYIAGGTVRDLNAFARLWGKPIPLPLVMAILGQILAALAAAHGQGIIHRDVTPRNVLLAGGTPEKFFLDPLRDPKVKLMDFGIAGQVQRAEQSSKSTVLGTMAYVAPEVMESWDDVTAAADVYGAGAVAYELVTGELPVGRFDAPSELREGLPEGLEELLLSLLSRRPNQRPAAAEVLAECDELTARTREAWSLSQKVVELGRELEAALEREDEEEVARLADSIQQVAGGRVPAWMERARVWLRERGYGPAEGVGESDQAAAAGSWWATQRWWLRPALAGVVVAVLAALIYFRLPLTSGPVALTPPPAGGVAVKPPAAATRIPSDPLRAEIRAPDPPTPASEEETPAEEPMPGPEEIVPEPPPEEIVPEPPPEEPGGEAAPEPEAPAAAAETEAEPPEEDPEEVAGTDPPPEEDPSPPPATAVAVEPADPPESAPSKKPEAPAAEGEQQPPSPAPAATDPEPSAPPPERTRSRSSAPPEEAADPPSQGSGTKPPRSYSAGFATLGFRTKGAEAEVVVYLNDRRLGRAPLSKRVPPGSYRIEGKQAGCNSDIESVAAAAGRSYEIVLAPVCGQRASAVVPAAVETVPDSSLPTTVPNPPPKAPKPSPTRWTPFSGAGTRWREKGSGLDVSFRFIPAGRFFMGSPPNERGRAKDEVLHAVELTRSFWVAETELTQGQWKAIMGPGNNPTAFPGCGDDCPADMISWFDALKFANLMSLMAGYEPCYRLSCRGQPGIDLICTDVRFKGLDCDGYRLPTEAEWEYATRAENYGPFPGKSLNELAWYYGNSRSRTHPVGRKAANRWGLRDVLGNLWEWVWDEYRRYSQGPATDPLQPFVSPRAARVFRGGSFGFWSEGDDLQIRFCRSASRYQGLPEERYPYVGFRLARTHR